MKITTQQMKVFIAVLDDLEEHNIQIVDRHLTLWGLEIKWKGGRQWFKNIKSLLDKIQSIKDGTS